MTGIRDWLAGMPRVDVVEINGWRFRQLTWCGRVLLIGRC